MGLSENSVPLNPMVLLIIIPIKWLFHWEYTQHFQTNPRGYWLYSIWSCTMDDVFQSPKPATLPTIAPARLACGHARATAPESVKGMQPSTAMGN